MMQEEIPRVEPLDIDVVCRQLVEAGGLTCHMCHGRREREIWDDVKLNYRLEPCDRCGATGFRAEAKEVLRTWLKKTVIRFSCDILHGDETHMAWLKEAAVAFGEGRPLPPPRKADS